jgi:ABC-type Fe3+-hydroxamate transport system substrate-binding protein
VYLTITDQCDRRVELAQPPQKIISLVPSQTELLYDLGLENRIAGITRYCVHPDRAMASKQVVGGTKKIVNQRVKDLQPDLIICNKEENTPAIVAFCEQLAPTYVSDVADLESAMQMMADIGQLTNTVERAQELCDQIQSRFALLNTSLSSGSSSSSPHALYLIWKNPYMSVGSDTFIHDMMHRGGFENVLNAHQRYPQLTISQMIDLEPDVILFSSEPYNFKKSDEDDVCSAFAKAGKTPPSCIHVDGELFSWYGSRLLRTPAYLKKIRNLAVMQHAEDS